MVGERVGDNTRLKHRVLRAGGGGGGEDLGRGGPDEGAGPLIPPLTQGAWLRNQPRAFQRACMLSRFSLVPLFATLRTVSPQAPLSMGFSMQNYGSGLTYPPPEED